MNIISFKDHLLKEHAHSSMYREYKFLELLRELTGSMIRFADFDDLIFRQNKARGFFVLMNNKIGLNKMIRYSDISAKMNFGSDWFIDFLEVNGAREEGSAKVSDDVRRKNLIRQGAHSSDPDRKKVWAQNGRGFWHQVTTESKQHYYPFDDDLFDAIIKDFTEIATHVDAIKVAFESGELNEHVFLKRIDVMRRIMKVTFPFVKDSLKADHALETLLHEFDEVVKQAETIKTSFNTGELDAEKMNGRLRQLRQLLISTFPFIN